MRLAILDRGHDFGSKHSWCTAWRTRQVALDPTLPMPDAPR